MNRLLLAGLLSCAVSAQAWAALPVGNAAPSFKTQASLAGKEFTYDLTKALKKGPVVVYFYPGAFTGGCNIQAHTFAEDMDKFKSAGATMSFQLFGGALSSPWRPMKSANACTP